MLKKISNNDGCIHREHNPPSHIVLEPGWYEYKCPKCGSVKIFEVQRVTW